MFNSVRFVFFFLLFNQIFDNIFLFDQIDHGPSMMDKKKRERKEIKFRKISYIIVRLSPKWLRLRMHEDQYSIQGMNED